MKPDHTHHALRSKSWFCLMCLGLMVFSPLVQAERVQNFGRGNPFEISDLPAGELKEGLQALDPKARAAAMQSLHDLSFHRLDAAKHLRVDREGGVYFTCNGRHEHDSSPHSEVAVSEESGEFQEATVQRSAMIESVDSSETEVSEDRAAAAVPVSSPPAYHSKPGAPYHIYLDFNGAVVDDSSWTKSYTDPDTGVTTVWDSWDCYAYDTDGDDSTFSSAEQDAMRQVWERVAEDYAPFNVNVTTDVTYDPDNYTGDKNKVGWLLITPITDKTGARCPHYGFGGVAYTGVFGDANYYPRRQPAWVLGQPTTPLSDIADFASHEMGHNMGLSHDGLALAGEGYYIGHSGNSFSPSWGPIMGLGGKRDVTQWSKGEYYDANQTQDDLAIISSRVPYRADDHGSSPAEATVWTGGVVSDSGIIERTDSIDYFEFTALAGSVSLTAEPYRAETLTWGGNLDIQLELYDSSGALVTSANPGKFTDATITTSVPGGTYHVVVRPTGAEDPFSDPPKGYTSYGSLGQYTVTGSYRNPDSIYLDTPAGGESWAVGNPQEITWVSGIGGNVKIELFKSGALYATLAESTENDGSYTWDVPAVQVPGDTYRIRITSLADPSQFDTSSADFRLIASNILYSANMDTDPGWTFSHSSWAWGQPTGVSQDAHGAPDPASGFAGNNVVGYRLDGDYEPNIQFWDPRWATTPAIDCSSAVGVNLTFQRWLGVEISNFDQVAIEVSNDGTNWTRVWTSTAEVDDGAWTEVSYDLSSVADGEPTVYIRWGMLKSDGSYNFCGWNIDDVVVSGGAPEGGTLGVSPAGDLNATGLEEGPFSPSSIQYTLNNPGAEPIDWQVTHTQDWISVSPASGTLAAGATSTVTVSIAANADTLASGSYTDTIGIFNTSTGAGDTTRTVSLTVDQLGTLVVDPESGYAPSGVFGGPFTPSSVDYTVSNPGTTAINWTVAKTVDWIDLSSAGGTLAAGASATLTVSVNSNADALDIGSYADTLVFTNTTDGRGNTTRAVDLTATPIPAVVTLSDLSYTYDGSAKAATVTTSPSGLSTDVTYDGSAVLPVDAGTYTVVATVTESNYAGSQTGELVIAKASQAITFASLDPAFDNTAPLALSATASSGLEITYSSSDTGVATVSGGTLTFVGPGVTTITAMQPGDNNYAAAAPVPQSLTVFRSDAPEAVIYEPFDDAESSLSGNASGTGIDGNWSGNAAVLSGSLAYGNLPAGSGNRASISNQSGDASTGTTLAAANLLDDNAELWFSLLVKTGGDIATNGDLGFALGTERINAGNNLPVANSGTALGFTFKQNKLQATEWAPTLTRTNELKGDAAPETLYLVVGKIIWGSASETIELYLPSSNLTLGDPVSTYTTPGNLDQAQFDTISFASKAATPAHEFDEIRFGATYESVVGFGGASDAVDSFILTGVPAETVVGEPIQNITITALTGTGATATSFEGTVTFGGTSGVIGTSSSFTAGELSGVTLTPTMVGTAVSITVDDGAGQVGEAFLDVLSLYQDWTRGSFTTSFSDNAPNSDPDGDNLTNLQEFAFGMDPTTGAMPTLSYVEGGSVVPGAPFIEQIGTGGTAEDFSLVYVRRKNHVEAGLVYDTEFSADLKAWQMDASSISIVPGSDPDYEVIKVTFPATVPLQLGGSAAPKFGRVKIE